MKAACLLPVALAAMLLVPASAARADAPRKPNFVFLYTDDQRWDAMSVVQKEQGEKGRFPWLKTPNLDRIAAEGVRFRNAFVVNSLCSPSRASYLTGCYGHVNGIRNNRTPFPEDNVTHATLLRQAGYATGYVGKWHMGAQRGKRPGFDYSASFVGQGQYFNCPVEINGVATPTKGWIDDVSTEYASQFIRKHKDRPFALVLGFKTCHGPFQPPPRCADLYGDSKARVVPNLSVKAVYRQDRSGASGQADGAGGDGVPTNLGMFRGITAIDENVGKILALLDELKLTDDTVVVFASDNGYYLGEHGLGDKRSAYEESIRIPLLVRYPRLSGKGRVVDQIALNIDLAPTLLDLAGVAVPKAMQGRSWRPLLEGRTTDDWRKAFFYCYFREPAFNTPMVTAVRTESAKLIKYPGHDEWTEVFDLATDPYEVKNLAKDSAAAALKSKLETEYEAQVAAISFRVPVEDDSRADRSDKRPRPKRKQKS
jgi:arylsulfatase A-like enzyme